MQQEIAGSESGYDAVRADESIQYAPIPRPEPSEPPSWLSAVAEFLADLFEPIGQLFGSSWPILKWVLVAGAAAFLLYLLWKLLEPALSLRSRATDAGDSDWLPPEEETMALLSDVDRLAAQGQYGAAVRLLLKRSIGQIAAAQPDWVEPSSTARELAAIQALPADARNAFGTIAERVERNLFALRELGAEDWQAARQAYARFALQKLAKNPR